MFGDIQVAESLLELNYLRHSRRLIAGAPRRGCLQAVKVALFSQFQLIITFIFLFLISDIRSDHLLAQSDRRYKIPTSPENFSREIPFSTQLARYCYRTFTFDKSYLNRSGFSGDKVI